MRLKRYIGFVNEWHRTEKQIPEWFIKLPTLESYLDPRTGAFYDYDEDGNWDDQDAHYSEEEFNEFVDDLTEEERKQVEAVWRSCEPLLRPLVDWQIIDDIKQCALAEEITDRGYQIRIQVVDGREEFANKLYTEWFDRGDVSWKTMFTDEYEDLEEKLGGLGDGLRYEIGILRMNDHGGYQSIDRAGVKPAGLQMKRRFMERIHSLHPGMEERIVFVRW